MLKGYILAGLAVTGATLMGSFPALAGARNHQVIRHEQRVPWYAQEPWIGTGPGYYYSYHPDHIPAYPKPLTGYPVPIFPTDEPVVHAAQTYRLASSHEEWCAARYQSYDARTDTFQPYWGPRRICRSPAE